MNRFIFKIVILLALIAIISFYLFGGLSNHDLVKKSLKSPNSERIHIAAAFCGKIGVVNRFKSLIKSVILMSEAEIEYHVIAEDLLRIEAELLYQSFPDSVKKRVTFTYYSVWFPDKNYEWWKKLYRPCATEKIFFSKIIREEVDSVLYFDLDAIIVGRVEKIWDKFREFEPQEIFGAVHDCPFPGCGYYNKMINKPVHVPAVGQSGLNSGVLFIKLDRIRNSNFLQLVEETAEKFKPNLIGAEQDVLNIIFNNFPKKLRFIDCSFNFMPHFYCKRPTICDRRNGIFVIHGAGMVFDINKDFSMTKIYKYVATIDLRRRKEAIIEELLSLVTEYTENCDCKSIAHQIFLY